MNSGKHYTFWKPTNKAALKTYRKARTQPTAAKQHLDCCGNNNTAVELYTVVCSVSGGLPGISSETLVALANWNSTAPNNTHAKTCGVCHCASSGGSHAVSAALCLRT